MSEESRGGPSDFAAGSLVAGYQLEEQIGRGGMAVVYRAHDPRLDRDVALKILAPGLSEDEAFRQRFIRESRAAAGVDEPHIIPVYEAGEDRGVLFIAMRFVRGGDIRSLLDRNGPLSPGRATEIVSQVASALDAAHARGLVHRDVKPANMLLEESPDSDRPDHVYLADFGLTKASLGQAAAGLTSTGQFLGTLDYVAPEQIEGRPVDGRTDLYALGCAAFELLTGAPPFRSDEGMAVMYKQVSQAPPLLSSRRPGLPREADEVLNRALAKQPEDRYQSCREFAAALRRVFGLRAESVPQAQPHLRPATQIAAPIRRPPDRPAPSDAAAEGGHGPGAGAVGPQGPGATEVSDLASGAGGGGAGGGGAGGGGAGGGGAAADAGAGPADAPGPADSGPASGPSDTAGDDTSVIEAIPADDGPAGGAAAGGAAAGGAAAAGAPGPEAEPGAGPASPDAGAGERDARPARSDDAAGEPDAAPARRDDAVAEPGSGPGAAPSVREATVAAFGPAASDQAASDQAASDPAASDPAASDPAASDQAASRPAASGPAASGPADRDTPGSGGDQAEPASGGPPTQAADVRRPTRPGLTDPSIKARGPAGPADGGYGGGGGGGGSGGPGESGSAPGGRRRSPWYRSPVPLAAICALIVIIGGGAFYLVGHHGGTSGGHGHTGGAVTSTRCPSSAPSTKTIDLKSDNVQTGPSPFAVRESTNAQYSFVSVKDGIEVRLNQSGRPPSMVRTISVPGANKGLSITSNDQYLLSANGQGAVVINVANAESGANPMVLGTMAAPSLSKNGNNAVGVQVTPDNNFAFVTMQNTHKMAVFNLTKAISGGFRSQKDYLVGYVPLHVQPVGISSPAKSSPWIYVTSFQRQDTGDRPSVGTMSVINWKTAETQPGKSVKSTVNAGCSPARVVLTGNGADVWVTARDSNSLLAFSAAKLVTDPGHALLADIPVGPGPIGLTPASGGKKLIVADSNYATSNNGKTGTDGQLAIVDTADVLKHNPIVIQLVEAMGQPRQVTLAPRDTLLVTEQNPSDAPHEPGQLQLVNIANLP